MNPKTIADAILGFVITFGTAAIALLAQEGVAGVGDVSQAAWLSSLIGALVAAAKTVQSRLAQPEPVVGGSQGQGGFAVVSLLRTIAGTGIVLLVLALLTGCGGLQTPTPNNTFAAASKSVEELAKEVGAAQKAGRITVERESQLLDQLEYANAELARGWRLHNSCQPGWCAEPAALLEWLNDEVARIRSELQAAVPQP